MSDTTNAPACRWLEDHDWCQGTLFRDKDGRTLLREGVVGPALDILAREEAVAGCALGAIRLAYTDPVDRYDAECRLERHLGVIPGDIPKWNDAPERTKEEVISDMCAAGV